MKFANWFNKYGSLFILPVSGFILFFIIARSTSSWAAIGYAIFMVVALISILLNLLFLWLNKWFKLELIWWKNLIYSFVSFIISYFLLPLLLFISR